MSYTHFCTRRIKAVRKPRVCIWCGESIPVGSSAVFQAGKWDGDFQSDYKHPECDAAMACMAYDDLIDGFPAYEFGRGRDDDRKDLPPMFTEADCTCV